MAEPGSWLLFPPSHQPPANSILPNPPHSTHTRTPTCPLTCCRHLCLLVRVTFSAPMSEESCFLSFCPPSCLPATASRPHFMATPGVSLCLPYLRNPRFLLSVCSRLQALIFMATPSVPSQMFLLKGARNRVSIGAISGVHEERAVQDAGLQPFSRSRDLMRDAVIDQVCIIYHNVIINHLKSTHKLSSKSTQTIRPQQKQCCDAPLLAFH